MLPLEHPTTLATIGETASAAAARIAHRLVPLLTPRRFAALSALAETANASSAGIASVLPAAIDDEIRNYAPGDLYLKVRPWRPAEALSASRQQIVSVALIGWDAFDTSIAVRATDDPCQRLALVPRENVDQAITALQGGAIDSIVIAGAADGDETIVREVKRLASRYFEAATRPLKLALAANGVAFAGDPAADALLARTKADLGATSHIVLADPPGVLIGHDGDVRAFLLLAGPDYCNSVRELASARNASEPAPSGFAEADAQAGWADMVAKASAFAAPSVLHWARIDRDYDSAAIFDQILSGGRL